MRCARGESGYEERLPRGASSFLDVTSCRVICCAVCDSPAFLLATLWATLSASWLSRQRLVSQLIGLSAPLSRVVLAEWNHENMEKLTLALEAVSERTT